MKTRSTTLIFSILLLLSSTTNLFVKSLPITINKNAVTEKQEENKENLQRELKAKS